MARAFRLDVDIRGAMATFRALGDRKTADAALVPAFGRAAIRVQYIARESLLALVYDSPEGAYRRTWTLFRSLHASRPRTSHVGDQARAFGGADLIATNPASVVRTLGLLYESEVGTWIDYAGYVHDGPHVRGPRPFMVPAAAQAAAITYDEIGQALDALIAQHVK